MTERDTSLVTIQEAAKILRVHPNTIHNYIQRGQLKAQRIGSRIIRIALADLDAIANPYQGGASGQWQIS